MERERHPSVDRPFGRSWGAIVCPFIGVRCVSISQHAVRDVPFVHHAALAGFKSRWRESGAGGVLRVHLGTETAMLDFVAKIFDQVTCVREIALTQRRIFD